MNVSQVSKIWLEYHRLHSNHNTILAYEFTIAKFNKNFASLNLNEESTDDILDFMAKFTKGLKPQTKRIRFSHLTAFFNFMRNNSAKRICSGSKNCTEADDFSDLLWSSQGNGGKSRQNGWNTIEATRSATSCSNIRIPFKCSFRDNFKSDFTTFEPFDHRNLFGKGQ